MSTYEKLLITVVVVLATVGIGSCTAVYATCDGDVVRGVIGLECIERVPSP